MELKKVAFEPMNEIHENEVKILNELLKKIENQEKIDDIYQEFLEDVMKHFSYEENLMEKYNFFAKIPHKMEHQRKLEELYTIKKEKLNDFEFLKNYFTQNFIPWLKNHVETMDTVTAGFFNMINAQK